MLTPLSKVHLTHRSSALSPPTHHTYIPQNIHGIGQLQSQALPLQTHYKQGHWVGRVREEGHTTFQTLNATQSSSYLTTVFVSSNHRTLHCPYLGILCYATALHTKPSQGGQQLNKQQKWGGGKDNGFWNKNWKKEGNVRSFSLFHDKDQKKLPQYIFNRFQFLLFFCIQFFWQLESHNG
jgi:hypothetical protein